MVEIRHTGRLLTQWVTAMKEDKNALVENDMWELVDCPKNGKVLRMKLNADGLTKWLHARQVTKGLVPKGRN